jgi:hypothetical protein
MASTASIDHPTRLREPWPTEITVVAWHDPLVETSHGAIPTASDDMLVWWSNSLGPASVLIARHLALYAAEGATLWSLDDLGGTFGLARSVVTHTLERLARFGVINRHGSTVAVRLMLPPLTARQCERLPRYLADAYPHE